jgi:1-pyrroline-5-carboxylate dehydrogenase
MSSSIPSWATADPALMGTVAKPYAVQNLVDGKWATSKSTMSIPHPLDRDAHPIFTIPDTQADELAPFYESLRKIPKSGVHNPLKNPDRYVQYGEISRKVRYFYSKYKFATNDPIQELWMPTADPF